MILVSFPPNIYHPLTKAVFRVSFRHPFRVVGRRRFKFGVTNAAVLDALTDVEGGRLDAPNGFLLGNGNRLLSRTSNNGGASLRSTPPYRSPPIATRRNFTNSPVFGNFCSKQIPMTFITSS